MNLFIPLCVGAALLLVVGVLYACLVISGSNDDRAGRE